jgi:hypothetical protein
MDRIGADAFVYAKACGMYARYFVGLRARKLFELKRLQELWSLVFSDEIPLVPEGMLALLLERKNEQRLVSDFISLASLYDVTDPVSRSLISLYDYNNLKAASSSALLGNKEPPFMVNVDGFSLLRLDKWPDIAAMTKNSPFSWYNRVPVENERVLWENRLDRQYYGSLWKAVESLGLKDRIAAEPLIKAEIILQNIVWALRLRVYYEKKADEIIPLLAVSASGQASTDIFCRDAILMLEKPIDSWNEWQSWKYRWLLNPHEEGVPWSADPRWAQLAAEKYLYRLALTSFHLHPFTVGVLVSFFKIQQLEAQMIRVATEGLRLGATEDQMREFMGDVQHV